MQSNLSKTFRYVNDIGEELIFEYDHGFLINKPVGIDTVSISHNRAQGIGQVGATIQSSNVQPRPVNISGRLVGSSQADNKERLLSVIRPDIPGKLYADDYYLNVNVTETPTIGPEPDFADFQFSLLAPYPYWLHDDSASATMSGIRKGFKFPWNISRPYRFGEIVRDAFINIFNGGQVPVPFTAILTANDAVSWPKITDAETGKFLLIKKNLVVGERLVIEHTHERTYVTSSVDGECRGALSLQSKLKRIAVGDNVWKPEAQSGLDNLQIDIRFSTEKTGVSV